MRTARILVSAAIIAWLFGGHQIRPFSQPATPSPPARIAHIHPAPTGPTNGSTGCPAASPSSPALANPPHPATAPIPPANLQPDDPTANLPILASATTPAPNAATHATRSTRLVMANSKYPLWRLEELQQTDPSSPRTRIIARTIAVADHVLVKTRPDLPAATLRTLCNRHGLILRKSLRTPGCHLLAVPSANLDTLPRILAALSTETNVILHVEPDHILHAVQTLPNDPSFSNLWGLHNTGQSGGTPDADIDAPEAWDISTGNPDVIVGVIDSGVDMTHPDLATNIWTNPLETLNGVDDDGNGYVDDIHGWDFVSGDNDPADANSHGTHCAGTIAAAGNNSIGVAGVTWRCRIMPLRFLDAGGSGYTSDAIDAIHYAADMRRRGIGIRLTSNSWGGGGAESIMSNAIRESGEAGLLFIAAAGNAGLNNDTTPFYPASYPLDNIIAVAATDRRDALAGFSCYGATSVDLGAPGSEIYSTIPGGYGTKNGTSMATPHVAGVAALLWSEWPDASPADVKDAIMAGVDPLPSLAGKTVTGGRLNSYGALLKCFRILHTPIPNTLDTGAPIAVSASIVPAGLVNTNQVWLFWNTDGSTNFTSVPLVKSGATGFEGAIPSQPEGAIIRYWLQASSLSGATLTHPSNAPAAIHQFTIMPAVSLTVTGSPEPHGVVTPDYGAHMLPSGMVIKASAELHTAAVEGSRWTCAGWTGTGEDIPASGASNAITFTLTRSATLDWRWAHEFALSQTTLVAGIRSTTTWWNAASTATTLTANETIRQGITNYAFAYWLLDGSRQPDPSQPAVNPVPAIVMDAPHAAAAFYLPETLDADADGMPDWWECRYFGSTNAPPDGDADGDGFSNLDEFKDRTSPRSPASVPLPPVIQHVPLPDPVAHPAPFAVEAVVTDNCSVAGVSLLWSRSDGPVQSEAMQAGELPGAYAGELPALGTNGDIFVYWILARDPLGQEATNGPHTVRIQYPLVQVHPGRLEPVVQPGGFTNLTLQLLNDGNAALTATVIAVGSGYSNTFGNAAAGWTTTGPGGPWVLDSYRFASPSNAWYNGDPATRLYANSMHACLDSPPIYLGTNAWLSFNHWIEAELDTFYWRPEWHPNHAWDGGIVEISTNNGASFQQIAPTGGYTHAISGWEDSPWSEGTPCFASSGGWKPVAFDLAPFANRLVIIRFHFGSDSNTPEEGWYIDDLVITPFHGNADWLSWTPTNLVLQPAAVSNVTATFAGGAIPTGNREGALLIAGNDPVTPVTVVPQFMRVRSPPVLGNVTASQTSTNGEGWVTISTTVRDADADPAWLQVEWTVNGSRWTSACIRSASVAFGSVATHGSNPPQVSEIATADGGYLVTNPLAVIWDTSTNGNSLGFSPATRVRLTPRDVWFQGQSLTSRNFRVINTPPPDVQRFTNTSQSAGLWSTNPVMNLSWQRVTSPDPGIAGYRVRLWNDAPSNTVEYDTPDTGTRSPPLPDSSNWWTSVRARDVYGNLGAPSSLGPFAIDTIPPSPAAAIISLNLERGGYRIATNTVSGTWDGFSDAGSGIAGYFCSLSNAAPSTSGLWTATAAATLTGLQPDRTNTFHVWARDRAGLVGPASSRPFLALSAGGDWDGDGTANAAEDIAGSNPADARSRFVVEGQASAAGAITVTWPSITNRLYTLAHVDRLAPVVTNWMTITNFVRIPGVDGTMSYTDQVRNIPSRFYRVTVEKP